ncbi:hypothetical protein [Brockia lithotrophica]|uniref:CRISPR type III-B/RAMP module-associated protein Cmr5 n=1 Tax=Brockia lithotrophica TaxID=933949 RepID=A0A660KUC6_9BACL|nr:hypothetical protein [Brockia lithotrophica]RKQ84648.1 hypothetical protein C7438_1137 [Brockia lithotrophica]
MREDRGITNLEIQCAKLGRELADIEKVNEKLFNEALAVLEEQGLYAMFLYVRARYNEAKDSISDKSLFFFQNIFGDRLGKEEDIQEDIQEDILEAVKKLAQNLDDLLFARDLLRTALSYARYFLKAKGGRGS